MIVKKPVLLSRECEEAAECSQPERVGHWTSLKEFEQAGVSASGRIHGPARAIDTVPEDQRVPESPQMAGEAIHLPIICSLFAAYLPLAITRSAFCIHAAANTSPPIT